MLKKYVSSGYNRAMIEQLVNNVLTAMTSLSNTLVLRAIHFTNGLHQTLFSIKHIMHLLYFLVRGAIVYHFFMKLTFCTIRVFVIFTA